MALPFSDLLGTQICGRVKEQKYAKNAADEYLDGLDTHNNVAIEKNIDDPNLMMPGSRKRELRRYAAGHVRDTNIIRLSYVQEC